MRIVEKSIIRCWRIKISKPLDTSVHAAPLNLVLQVRVTRNWPSCPLARVRSTKRRHVIPVDHSETISEKLTDIVFMSIIFMKLCERSLVSDLPAL